MKIDKFKLIRLKNAMLFSNLMANMIGVSIVMFLIYGPGSQVPPAFTRLSQRINIIFLPFAFIFPTVINILYERPIRRYLNKRSIEEPMGEQEAIKAHQRLLNEPFFLIAMDFAVWLVAAILYPAVFWSLFGAPVFREDHAVMAVRAAVDMRTRLHDVNQDLERKGYPALSHGIGVHTGLVLAANIGSPDRLSYALIGDTVNLASRLQGLNKEFGTEMIISAATRGRINGHFSFKELPATRVKGKTEAIEIFTL